MGFEDDDYWGRVNKKNDMYRLFSLALTCHLCRKLEFQTAFKRQKRFERTASIEPKAL